MRSSVHDLISLGLGPASSPEAGSPARANRTHDRAADTEFTGESTSFGLLLAMAALNQPASLPATPLPRHFATDRERLAVDASGPVAIDHAPHMTTWRARVEFPAADGGEQAPAGTAGVIREQWGARIHDLFQSITGEAPPPVIERAGASERSAPALLPLDGSRREATVPQPVRELARGGVAGDPAPAANSSRAMSGGNLQVIGAPPAPAGQELKTAARPAPALTIVARNDRPADPGAPHHPAQPANLRVIHPDGTISRPHVHVDLLDRLADSWRQAFAGNDATTIDQNAESLRGGGEQQVHVDADSGAIAALDAGAPRSIEMRGSEGRATAGDGFSEPASASSTESNRSATVVPLFGDLMAAEPQQPEIPADVPVTTRRAIVEIAAETFRLEQAGGSELSFTMKLMPEHLGEIEIDIQRVDDRWTISITASGDAARDALAAEIHRLERALREHDLTLESVNVVTRGPEPALSAPQSSEQAAQADWFGHQNRHFGGHGNWDESGWQSRQANETIGFESGQDVGMTAKPGARRAGAPLSNIDIQA